METHDFTNAKVGDLVTDLVYGHGVIINIDNTEWPLDVKFRLNRTISYTHDGRTLNGEPQRLYHGKVDFKIEVIEPCPYEVGEWIAVRNNNSHAWEIAKFEFVNHEGCVRASGIKWVYHASLSSFNQSK